MSSHYLGLVFFGQGRSRSPLFDFTKLKDKAATGATCFNDLQTFGAIHFNNDLQPFGASFFCRKAF